MIDSYKNRLYVLQETNYYKILGVKETDPIESISKEYRHLAKLLHPDMNLNIPQEEKNEINLIFKKINQAYDIIKDPDNRRKFDLELKLKRAKELGNELKKVKENKQSESPKNPENNNQPGFIFTGVKINEEAALESAKKIRKERELIQFNQAKIHINEHNYDEAIYILRNLTEKDSREAKYHSLLGLAMEAKGWNGYAQAEFKVALHYDPNDSVALKHYKPSGQNTKEPEKSQEKHPDTNSVFGKIKSLFNKK